jgi:hypothetical protein
VCGHNRSEFVCEAQLLLSNLSREVERLECRQPARQPCIVRDLLQDLQRNESEALELQVRQPAVAKKRKEVSREQLSREEVSREQVSREEVSQVPSSGQVGGSLE